MYTRNIRHKEPPRAHEFPMKTASVSGNDVPEVLLPHLCPPVYPISHKFQKDRHIEITTYMDLLLS